MERERERETTKRKALLEYVVVSSPQCFENIAFFSSFPLGGIHGSGMLSVIPLKLQGKKHQPFSMTQPTKITHNKPKRQLAPQKKHHKKAVPEKMIDALFPKVPKK